MSCDDVSSGKYLSIGNYLSRPMNGETLKIATLPLPKLEFHNGCKAYLSRQEYMIPLKNDIEIIYNKINGSLSDILYVRIVLYLRFAEHDFMAEDFSNIDMSLYACHDGGVHQFEKNNAIAPPLPPANITVDISRCSTITLTQSFKINSSDNTLETELDSKGAVVKKFLRCVSALKYQLSLTSGIRVKRKSCSHKLIKDCTPYSYTGDAYVSLTVP